MVIGLSVGITITVVTPPEAEPGSPHVSSTFHQQGDYFGVADTDQKKFTPTLVPIDLGLPLPTLVDQVRRPSPPAKVSSETSILTLRKRRRNSIFNEYRLPPLTDSTFEAPRSGILGTEKVGKLAKSRISLKGEQMVSHCGVEGFEVNLTRHLVP